MNLIYCSHIENIEKEYEDINKAANKNINNT